MTTSPMWSDGRGRLTLTLELAMVFRQLATEVYLP